MFFLMKHRKRVRFSKAIRLSLLFPLFVTGCATVGSQFSFTGPENIAIGKTTRNEILKAYGEPFRVGYDNGNEKWTYGYYKYRLFGDSDTKDLDITFDKSGLVSSYSYSSSLNEDKQKIGHSGAK